MSEKAVALTPVPAARYANPPHKLSGALRDRYERGHRDVFHLDKTTEANLLATVRVPRDPIEKGQRLIEYLSRTIEDYGEMAPLTPNDWTVPFCKSSQALDILRRSLIDQGFIIASKMGSLASTLTLKGWSVAIEMRRKRVLLDQAFVAMWFDEKNEGEMRDAYDEGFKPALEKASYRPVRIDEVHHNQLTIDRILAEIRRSALVVADFTGHRGGVYFEAGFGLGLDAPIIWTVRKDHLATLHFDIKGYNHIVWDTFDDLKEKLAARVMAMFPVPNP